MSQLNDLKKMEYKKTVGFFVLFTLTAFSVYAQDGTIPAQLTTAVDNIYAIFNSGITKTLLMIAFCGLVIGMIFSWDSQGAKKKFFIWLVAVVALMNVEPILTFFGWAN